MPTVRVNRAARGRDVTEQAEFDRGAQRFGSLERVDRLDDQCRGRVHRDSLKVKEFECWPLRGRR